MKLLQVDTIEEAREKLWKQTAPMEMKTEILPILEAGGRYLAKDVVSSELVPGFRRTSVDGYAVVSSDTMGASENMPVFLQVTGEIAMGEEAVTPIRSGECVYVPTGGMLPPGADAMVMVEYCESFSDHEIAVYASAAPGSSVVEPGEDMKPGDLVLEKGRRLRAQDIAALASLGIMEVEVFVPWKVTILSTGDEIVDPTRQPKPGQIRDVNTYGIMEEARQMGLDVVHYQVVKDQEELLKTAIRDAMEQSDLVAISGGSSQGKKDKTNQILDELAEGGVFTHGLALKPGKPTILAVDQPSSTVLMGLPGHPVAAMQVFELLAGWLWRRKIQGREPFTTTGVMQTNLPGAPGRKTCQLVQITERDGERKLDPVFGKSGLISTLTRADGYVVIGENQEGLKKGEQVTVYLL